MGVILKRNVCFAVNGRFESTWMVYPYHLTILSQSCHFHNIRALSYVLTESRNQPAWRRGTVLGSRPPRAWSSASISHCRSNVDFYIGIQIQYKPLITLFVWQDIYLRSNSLLRGHIGAWIRLLYSWSNFVSGLYCIFDHELRDFPQKQIYRLAGFPNERTTDGLKKYRQLCSRTLVSRLYSGALMSALGFWKCGA